MNFCIPELFNFILLITILLGLSVGSFLNVCIYRIPRHESISFPPSHCPNCMNKIKWFDNIPVLSFIILKGKCRNCKSKISIRYPLIELLNCVLWIVTFIYSDNRLQCLTGFAFSSILIIVSCIDLQSMEIPDSLNVAILLLAIVKFIASLVLGGDLKDLLIDLFVGALAGSLLLYGLYMLLLKLVGKEGLGGGDVKLAFACGAFLGWKEVLFGIALSAYIGLLVILIYSIIKRKGIKGAIPYGPFLSLGFLISFLFFDDIYKWYMLKFFGLII
ncbi:MAG: prepilin peptidase [Lachnospiraceae bacterium]|nr:prepilin peptidase [Lachnospiraceae bacterium]